MMLYVVVREEGRGGKRGGGRSHERSLLEAMTRNQSRTLCFLRYFFVRYLRYLPGTHLEGLIEKPGRGCFENLVKPLDNLQAFQATELVALSYELRAQRQ